MARLTNDERSVLWAMFALIVLFALAGECDAQISPYKWRVPKGKENLSEVIDTLRPSYRSFEYNSGQDTMRPQQYLYWRLDKEGKNAKTCFDQDTYFRAKEIPLDKILAEIELMVVENGCPIYFVLKVEDIEQSNRVISFPMRKRSLVELLTLVLRDTDLTFIFKSYDKVCIFKQSKS